MSTLFTANSKQQTANSKQQTANSKQQTANSKQQTVWRFRSLLLAVISLAYLFLNIVLAFHCYSDAKHIYFPLIKSLAAVSLIPLICLSLWRYLGAVLLALYSLVLFFWLVVSITLDRNLFSVHSFLGMEQIKAVLSTNEYEAKSYLVNHYLAIFLSLILVISIFLLALRVSKFQFRTLSLSLIATVFLIGLASERTVHKLTNHMFYMYLTNKEEVGFRVFLNLNKGMTGVIAYSLYQTLLYRPHSPKLHEETDPLITGLLEDKNENIILVVGESATARRHGFYNQVLQTTPLIGEQIRNGHACAIKDAHSSGNITWTTVPFITSFSTPDHLERTYSKKNIVELSHDAGYHNYWIDAQYAEGGVYADSYGYVRKYSDTLYAPDYKQGLYHPHTDIEVVNALNSILKDTEYPHKFIVLHLTGSHEGYSDKFDSNDSNALPKSSEYDRTIHHTDRVLDDVIKSANKALKGKFILFYTSDHGQDLVKNTHGLDNGSVQQYQIPVLLAWGSNVQGERWCNRVEELRTPEHLYPQIMDKVILSEMMGYSTNPELVNLIRKNDIVRHSDGEVYKYKDVPVVRN